MIAETTPGVRGAHAEPMVPRPYRVRRLRRELTDTFTQELVPVDGGEIPPFQAGQFNMLYVFGVGEIPISISGDPARRDAFVHTTRAVGAVSRALRELSAGDVLGLRGPFGTSWPLEAAAGRDLVIAAGGVGLPPLRPAIYSILRERERYGRVSLLYGARTPKDLLFLRELEQWRSQIEVYVTVDYATADWKGNVGVVTKLIPRAQFDPETTVAIACGPEVMFRFTAKELEARGISTERIYVSMERNMKCAVGLCGHCQYSGAFVCKDGPVFPYSRVRALLSQREI
jgi:NAD(P)H-flavin reductase